MQLGKYRATDATSGSCEEVSCIVTRLRERWVGVEITLRAESGIRREELMAWCESNHVDCIFDLARDQRLAKILANRATACSPLHTVLNALFLFYRRKHCERAFRHLGDDIELRIDQFGYVVLHLRPQEQRHFAIT